MDKSGKHTKVNAAKLHGLSLQRAGDPCFADVPEELFAGDPAKWIGKAIKRPGALHRQLGVPQGQKIPAKKMAAARAGKEGPLAKKRASLAKTLKSFH